MKKEITVDGQRYIVLAEKPFKGPNGEQRKMLSVKRPKGRREYFAIVFENGVTEVILP